MNSLMKAIKNKVHAGEKKVKSGFKKTTNFLGDVLSRPSRLDSHIIGSMADEQRQKIKNRRERRQNDKAMYE